MNVPLELATQSAMKLASETRLRTALRLLFPIALIEAALWSTFWLGIVCGILAIWYVAWQLWRATSSVRSLGLDLRGLSRAYWLLGTTVALAVVILATAYFSGSLHRLWGLQHPWYAILTYSCWAFVQEFMLQCFCLRMLRALVSRISSLLLSGAVFAVAHLPNPGLTLITFFAGIVFSAIYAQKRNLYVVALIHAVLGLTLAVSAPVTWFHELRVGRQFLEAPSTLAAADISPNR